MSNLPIRFMVLDPADTAVAKLLLRESPDLPECPSAVERRAFRARWEQWLWGLAPGPIDVGRMQVVA